MTNEDIIRRVKEILVEQKAKSGMSIPALWAIFSSDGSALSDGETDEKRFRKIVERECSSKNGELEKPAKKEKKDRACSGAYQAPGVKHGEEGWHSGRRGE